MILMTVMKAGIPYNIFPFKQVKERGITCGKEIRRESLPVTDIL